jgi:hypothetical protein
MNCCCSDPYREGRELLDQFAEIRRGCPVLGQLLVPDADWNAFQEWDRQPRDDVHHRSMLLLALERDHLGALTGPLHRFLVEDGRVKATVTKQYRQDLRERWLVKSTEVERHQKSRGFLGKVVELHVAAWLEQRAWRVVNLAALGGQFDIEATPPEQVDGAPAAPIPIEVKFIGTEDPDFGAVLQSARTGPHADSRSLPAAANYAQFRLYEAALQIQKAGARGIAILVIDDYVAWPRIEFVLPWIDWEHPHWFPVDESWRPFWQAQVLARPQIEQDLPDVLAALDLACVLRLVDGFRYLTERTWPMPAPRWAVAGAELST